MGSHFDDGLTLEEFLNYEPEPIPNYLHPYQNQSIQSTLTNSNSLSNSSFSISPSDTASPSNSNSTNSNSNSTNSNSNSYSITHQDSTEEVFSDFVFSYIDKLLMEEERSDSEYQPEDYLATEQQFSEVLDGGPFVQLAPPQHSQLAPVQSTQPYLPDYYNDTSNNVPYEITSNDHSLFYGNDGNYNGNTNVNRFNGWDNIDLSHIDNNQLLFASTNSLSSISPPTTTNSSSSESRNISTPNIPNDTPKMEMMGLEESMFRKGIEEAQKFLPKQNNLVINLESSEFNFSPSSHTESNSSIIIKKEEPDQRVRKNRYEEDHEFESEYGRRNNKQIAYADESVREMFDKILLGGPDKCMEDVRELRAAKDKEIRTANTLSQSIIQNNGGKSGRGRRKSSKEVVDLRTILIHCAQAVATDDRRSATELLRQIRQHASPVGDATQRLAQCFYEGLQARMAGTGSHLYQSLIAKRTSAGEMLKAYQLYMAACPFKKLSYFFSNRTILDIAKDAKRVHIIDFGIHYGFQWPCLLKQLSQREDGPPVLKITGIDNPQPGFRPEALIQETGRRLSDYAKQFEIPFEYHSITSKWEDVKIEDIGITANEIVVVNCLFHLKNLPDETVNADSPRDAVLKMIRKMKPNVFIHGIVNGSYSAPFFVTRFREALFHYSALFDMLEANVPRENEHRLLIERDLFGRGALNVIACEGAARIERPETYKQWQVRNLRAGLKQLALDQDILKKGREKVKNCYHKDFVVDVDNGWLLQGWKGRIVYGMSTWKSSE